MNRKKIFLSIITAYALCNALQTVAMFSKLTFDKEDKEYSKTEMEKQQLTELLHQECFKKPINLNTISMLIKKGADINSENYLGARPLHYAAVSNDLKFAKLLITHGANIDAQDNEGNTPLHVACEEGNIDIIELLCDKGANLNIPNNMGRYPLHRACDIKNLKIITYLIRKGALINATTNSLLTPLHIACQEGSLGIVGFLIQNGADVNATNYKGYTPLHYASFLKHTNIMALLIKNGANVNAQSKSPQWAPLHAAVETNNLPGCTLLLQSGADPLITTSEGMTPLDIAYDLEYKKIIDLLQSYNPQTNEQADAHMRAFFEELNQEAVNKQKKTANKIKKTQTQQIPDTEINPAVSYQSPPQPSSSEITADELIINQLIEDELETTIPATEIVIETPPTIPSPVAQPTASAAVPERPTKIVQQKSIHPDVAPAPRNNGYLILIGQNLKWPQLNKNQEQLIKNNLLSLKNWPAHNLDIKQLKGEVNLYRLRVGNYRIIFAVDTVRREIKVQKIGLRKEIYKQYKS